MKLPGTTSLKGVIALAQTAVNMPHMHLAAGASLERQGCFDGETLHCTWSVSQRKFYFIGCTLMGLVNTHS